MIDRILKGFKRLCWLVGLLIVGWVAFATYVPGGVTESVTTNMDAPMTTRTLAPRVVTTTTAPAVITRSLPIHTAADSTDILVVDGERVYRLPRSQQVMLYLWLATHIGDNQ